MEDEKFLIKAVAALALLSWITAPTFAQSGNQPQGGGSSSLGSSSSSSSNSTGSHSPASQKQSSSAGQSSVAGRPSTETSSTEPNKMNATSDHSSVAGRNNAKPTEQIYGENKPTVSSQPPKEPRDSFGVD